MAETRCWSLPVVLAAACLTLAGCAVPESQEPSSDATYIHFFVVPQALPDGTSAEEEIVALRGWLAGLTGGYTEFADAPGGWLDDRKDFRTEAQVAFFLSDRTNRKAEISKYLKAEFKQQDPYIEVWTALD